MESEMESEVTNRCLEDLARKCIILRTLEDSLSKADIPESLLQVLEKLEALLLSFDSSNSNSISAAMKAAYCSIAVECTVKFLEVGTSNPSYVNAVDSIWKCRFQDMQNDGSSFLLSDELKQWKRDIENSLLDATVMEKLASMPNTRRDAIRKVHTFLSEAYMNLGLKNRLDASVGVFQMKNQPDKDSVPKNRESLQCSSGELQTLAKDMNHPHMENPSTAANVPDPEACHNDTPCHSDAHHPSLMKPHECDDSIDGLQGKSSYEAFKFSLPSPRRVKVSPLKPYEPKKIPKRRRIKKWSKEEEETLRTGVNKFGSGNWKLILDTYTFEERTQVDLKDKWRNLMRNARQ